MSCKTKFIAAFAALFGATQVTAQDAEFIVSKDVSYGDYDRNKLDIYSPATINPGTPIIVFFHGGAWRSGRKENLSVHGESFAASGMIFVSANYRLYPNATFPDFIEDAAAAVAFAQDAFPTKNRKPHPIFLSGWSAGAYNAALLAYDERFLAQHGVQSGIVKGLIGLSGPYEGGLCAGIRCEHIFHEDLREDWTIASQVDGKDPPALLIVAEEDPYVPARHHEDLAEAIRSAGVKTTVYVLPSRFHNATKMELLKKDSELRALVDEFIADAISK